MYICMHINFYIHMYVIFTHIYNYKLKRKEIIKNTNSKRNTHFAWWIRSANGHIDADTVKNDVEFNQISNIVGTRKEVHIDVTGLVDYTNFRLIYYLNLIWFSTILQPKTQISDLKARLKATAETLSFEFNWVLT